MSGWQFKHEERDGRLVSVPIYNNPEDSVCDREEYDEAEIKHCKECNHDGLLLQDCVGWFVRCEVDTCDNFSGYFDTPEEAIAAWNRRAK